MQSQEWRPLSICTLRRIPPFWRSHNCLRLRMRLNGCYKPVSLTGQGLNVLGFSAESPNTWRNLLTAWFRLSSNSTNVSAAHNLARNSSRVTTSPGRSARTRSISKAFGDKATFSPSLWSSPDVRSNSNSQKRSRVGSGPTPARRLQVARQFSTKLLKRM